MKRELASVGWPKIFRVPALTSAGTKDAKRADILLPMIGLLALVVTAGAVFLLVRPPAFEAIHPRIGPAVVAVYASGTVEATVMLPVAPRVGGRLLVLSSDEHARVRKGQVLARLEDTDVKSNIAQLQANAMFAKNDLDRYARLRRENAIALQIYDRALANWKAADAAVRQAQAQAGYMTLLAPGDCDVIQRDGEIGQYIAANVPIFWLSCHPQLRISALVDEEDVSLLRPGQTVLIRADAFPRRVFQARVTEITPKGDSIGRSYRVRIELPADTPLQIGMTTESNIIVRRNDRAVLVPAKAIAADLVWRIENGEAVRTPVVAGAKDKDWIEVVSGLKASDTLLIDGSAKPGRQPKIRLVGP